MVLDKLHSREDSTMTDCDGCGLPSTTETVTSSGANNENVTSSGAGNENVTSSGASVASQPRLGRVRETEEEGFGIARKPDLPCLFRDEQRDHSHWGKQDRHLFGGEQRECHLFEGEQ